MAVRPVYFAVETSEDHDSLVIARNIEFKWHSGLAKTQKQKNIRELHTQIKNNPQYTQRKILEISSKSEEVLGVQLSAFNLMLNHKGKLISVESAFQASKVFRQGGPYYDLVSKPSIEAKKDPRLKSSGDVIKFVFEETEWDTEPKTLFYDWLYIRALRQNPTYANQIVEYNAFTDIEFNPDKSFNCQARSAALYITLYLQNQLEDVMVSPEAYVHFIKGNKVNKQTYHQQTLL